MANDSEFHEYSLSIASVRKENIVALGITNKIFITFKNSINEEVIIVNDEQIVRDVDFLRSPGGDLCLVSAGDAKYINIYKVPLGKINVNEEIQDKEVKLNNGLPLLFRFGPHTKRITHIATCNDQTILFADKFGEVFRFEIIWGPDNTISIQKGDEIAPLFLLQHFSVMSSFFLSAPIKLNNSDNISLNCIKKGINCNLSTRRRLFTCDKDRHVRVSCYPETFRIEQFLWTEAPQSVVTSITEILNPNDVNCRYSYFLIGCLNGKVHFWIADNNVLSTSSENPFTLINSFSPQQVNAVEDASTPAVISIVHVSSSSSVITNSGLENDVNKENLKGIFIAYESSTKIVFVPLINNREDNKLILCTERATQHTSLNSFPIAMIGVRNNAAFLLDRNGEVRVLSITSSTNNHSSNNDNINEIQVEEQCDVQFSTIIVEHLKDSRGISLLQAVDLFALWNFDAIDPRNRKRLAGETMIESNNNNNNESDEEEEEDEVRKLKELGEGKKMRTEKVSVVNDKTKI